VLSNKLSFKRDFWQTHGVSQITRPTLIARLTAEAVGTALLVATVVGSGIMAQRLSPDDVGLQLLENAAATTGALIALILALGPVSGAHFNPVVSMVARLFGGLSTRDTVLYSLVQIAGGCIGAMIANVMFELDVVNLSTKDRSSAALWFSEVIATIGLVLIIFCIVRSGRASAVPYAVGVWIGGAYWFTSSTSFANPAVDFARSLSNSFAGIKPSSIPGFLIAQIVGGLLAFVLVKVLYPVARDEEAK
jgi:glycerol uptake facilitator-like aquaporin